MILARWLPRSQKIFFYEHFNSSVEQLQECRWLQIKAANGLEVPYLGYLEIDIQVLGKIQPRIGVLVVQNSSITYTKFQKSKVPGLLGMNVISQCYDELFQQHGSTLFHAPLVRSAGKAWKQAFTDCQQLDRLPPTSCLGKAKVAGRTSVRIPAGSTKFVSCNQHIGFVIQSVLLEPVDCKLPPGLLLSRAILDCDQGQVYVPVVNVE